RLLELAAQGGEVLGGVGPDGDDGEAEGSHAGTLAQAPRPGYTTVSILRSPSLPCPRLGRRVCQRGSLLRRMVPYPHWGIIRPAGMICMLVHLRSTAASNESSSI